MQMLFTLYHMVLFQVITRRRAFPLINMKGWSENTVYQETLWAYVRNVIKLTLGCWNLFQATQLTYMLIAITVWFESLAGWLWDRLVPSKQRLSTNKMSFSCDLKFQITCHSSNNVLLSHTSIFTLNNPRPTLSTITPARFHSEDEAHLSFKFSMHSLRLTQLLISPHFFPECWT